MVTLAVFPNDALFAYVQKGEVKPRYFNPTDLFSRVHVFTFTKKEAPLRDVQTMFGSADVTLHELGHINLLNYRRMAEVAADELASCKCDVVRAYNPLLQGYAASVAAERCGLPFVLSVHSNYDHDARAMALAEAGLGLYLKLLYTKWFVEPRVIERADVTICAYRFVEEYVRRRPHRAVRTIYNRVYLDEYRSPPREHEPLVVITVGGLDRPRNHGTLVRAAIDAEVKLLVVGDGPERERLASLARGHEDMITFIPKVPHGEIAGLYTACDVFALAMKYGGISIPVLEAMAAGLPLVLPRENIDGDIDVVRGAALLVENDHRSFAHAFRLLKDPGLRAKLGEEARKLSMKFEASALEEEEAEVYRSLLRLRRG
jgi:glycosyltransferase involved in cell wall biosynthesis